MRDQSADSSVQTSGIRGEIMRDTMRTFPWHPFFHGSEGPGEVMLGRILQVLATVHNDVGYCQVLPHPAVMFDHPNN